MYKDALPTCAEWCAAAEECLGDAIDVAAIKAAARGRGPAPRTLPAAPTRASIEP